MAWVGFPGSRARGMLLISGVREMSGAPHAAVKRTRGTAASPRKSGISILPIANHGDLSFPASAPMCTVKDNAHRSGSGPGQAGHFVRVLPAADGRGVSTAICDDRRTASAPPDVCFRHLWSRGEYAAKNG